MEEVRDNCFILGCYLFGWTAPHAEPFSQYINEFQGGVIYGTGLSIAIYKAFKVFRRVNDPHQTP